MLVETEITYAVVLGLIHAQLSFVILRTSILYACGSHTKRRGLGPKDGAAIDLTWSPLLSVIVFAWWSFVSDFFAL